MMAANSASGMAGQLEQLFLSCLSGVPVEDYGRSFSDLEVDSFGLVELRLMLEQQIGHAISDNEWTALATPSELQRFMHRSLATASRGQTTETTPTATLERTLKLNMPQMALGGLSESWLFKNLGDMHWELICRGLETPSDQLADGNGERLYATFTRFHLRTSSPLAGYLENETLSMRSAIARFGAGIFHSEVEGSAGGKKLTARIMSSFAKRGTATSNANLLKGQPTIPPGCVIPTVDAMPALGIGYRERRNTPLAKPRYEANYDLQGCHDINGVGLLYFAAYPSITDLCEVRFMGRGNRWALDMSTVERDICYFANCDIDDGITYRVHAMRETTRDVEIESSLSRRSDNRLMAYVVTRKEKVSA
jgi:probable biosynthetic protein (TIGR04098 family)